jgi:O-antigen ligase
LPAAIRFPSAASLALAGLLAVGTLIALAAPLVFWLLLVGVAALGVGFLAFRHAPVVCALWIVVTGCTLEMTLYDLIGPDAFQGTIAVVKGVGLALAAICVLRYGLRIDPLTPAFGFAAMFAVGLIHGLHPGLTAADSARSLAGSVAPFAFFWVRPSRDWACAIVKATQWAPLVCVGGGAALALAGTRPLFVDLGGERLAALGHPAFLAGVALAAIYASLIQLYREGRRRDLGLLICNGLILVLTGARAPLLYGATVVGLTLGFVPAPALARSSRHILLLAAAAALPPLAAAAGSLGGLRLFNALANYADSLSGREELWRLFEQAASTSPWVGWGVGAGNAVVPRDGDVMRFMHTIAAHNEWLRIDVEGGAVGLVLLVVLFVLWTWRHTVRLAGPERIIMRLAFVGFACHAFTDNVLISTPACLFFGLAAAVFARGTIEAAERERTTA